MYNIEITPTSVSIGVLRKRTLVDPSTGEEVVQDLGMHRTAMSVSDFDGDQEAYEAAVNVTAMEQIGRTLYGS